jgi:hypothetical protein
MNIKVIGMKLDDENLNNYISSFFSFFFSSILLLLPASKSKHKRRNATKAVIQVAVKN